MDAGLGRAPVRGEAGGRVRRVGWGWTWAGGGVDATAMGFPRVLRDSDGTRVPDQLNGTINPGVALGDQYDLLVTGPLPEASAAHPSPWAGLSGAALFSRDLIIGVVRADLPAWRHGRLSAVPLHRLLQDSEFSAHLAKHGCPIWADSVELAPLLDRPSSRLDSPASLLRADNEVVEFHGRKELLENLNAWCVDKESLSLRLITAPGGQGKTRLARQLVSGLREHRWVAGFLADAELPGELMNRLADSTWPVLLVVDQADGRTDQAKRLVHAVGNFPQSKIRLLLLARSAGDWWKELSPALRPLCNLTDPYSLPPVDDSIQRRKAAYDDAVRDFADRLSRLPEWSRFLWRRIIECLPEPDLGNSAFESILDVQFQALVHLLNATEPRESQSAWSGDVEQRLLEHEQVYWSRTASRQGLTSPDYPLAVLATAVAAAALTGADSEDEAVAVISRVPGLAQASDGAKQTVARWIANMYPPSSEVYWGSLQPDRVGDRHIAEAVRKRPTLLSEVLHGADSGELHHASAVLARAMHSQPSLAAHVVDLLGGNDLDSILAYADPYLMLDALRDVQGATAHAVADVYRKCARMLQSQDPGERASQLELAARQMGHFDLAERISAAYPNRPFRTRWVHWPHESTLAVVLDRTAPMRALAIIRSDDRDVLLIADDDAHVMLSSLDGDPRPRTITRHQSTIDHILTASINNRAYLISIDQRGDVYVGALTGDTPSRSFRHPTDPSHSRVGAAAIAGFGGRPVLITACGSSVFATQLEMESGPPFPKPLISLPSEVTALALIPFGKELVVIAGCGAGQVYRISLAKHPNAQLLLQHPVPNPDRDSYHVRTRRRPSLVALGAANVGAKPLLASADTEGNIYILRLDQVAEPRVIPVHNGIVDSLAILEVRGRPMLVSSSPGDGLKSTWIDETRPKPQRLGPQSVPGYMEDNGDSILTPFRDSGGDQYVLFANTSNPGVWAIPLEGKNGQAHHLASDSGQVTAIAAGVSGGRVIVASAHGTGHLRGALLISRLATLGEDKRFRQRSVIYEMALGYKDNRPVLAVQHSGSLQERTSDLLVTAYWLDAEPDPFTFTDGKDCYWDHRKRVISARNHRAISRLPRDISIHSGARMALHINNDFIYERGRYFEIKLLRVDDDYNERLFICHPGARGEETPLIEHDEPITGFCVRRFGERAVLLFTDSRGRLMTAVRRGGKVTKRTLAVHGKGLHALSTALQGARIGDEYIVVSASDGPGGEVWSSWLTSDLPPTKIATLDDAVKDIAIMQHETKAAVIISHGDGNLTITGLTNEAGRGHAPTTVQFGVPVDKLAQYEQTILAGTGAGVAAFELNQWYPFQPIQSKGAALGDEATDWASLLQGYHPLPTANGAPSSTRTWIPWAAAAAMAAAVSSIAVMRLGLPWMLPAWLYLGYVLWSDQFTEWAQRSTWRRRYLTALALLTIPAGLEGQWLPIARGAAAIPMSVIVIGLLSIEQYSPSGQQLWTFFPTLRLTFPRTWRDLSIGVWQRISRLTYAQNRSYLAGFLGLFLADLGWHPLIAGAVLPVTAGIAGLLINRYGHVWAHDCDSRAVLLLGGLIGVIAPAPVVHVTSKIWVRIAHFMSGFWARL
jgi:hypothetical protein